MTTDIAGPSDAHPVEADVSKLQHMMGHSFYLGCDAFLRQLISNAVDPGEKLRHEGIATPSLLGDDPQPHISMVG